MEESIEKFMRHEIFKNEYYFYDKLNPSFRSENIEDVKKRIFDLEKDEIKELWNEVFLNEDLKNNNTICRLYDINADLLESLENSIK